MKAQISRAAAQAMLNRAVSGLLISAAVNKPQDAQFWRGSINALRSLLEANGAEFSALKDAASGAYQPPADLEAAWAALPVDVERLPLVEVQQFLAAQGVKITADTVAHSQINTVLQLKHGEIATVNLDDEHAARAIDVCNGSEHGQASCGSAIVAEGGSA